MSSVLIMEEISRRAARIYQIQNIFLIQHRHLISKKIFEEKKALTGRPGAKKFERDKKALFGPLVETLPEKRKRINSLKEIQSQETSFDDKIEGNVRNKGRSYKNHEMDFLIKSVNKKNLSIVPSSTNSGQQQLKNKDLIYNLINKPENRGFSYTLQTNEISPKDVNSKKITLSEGENSKNEIYTQETKLETNDDNSETKVNLNATAPSAIIIQNMLSFSLYDSTKSGRIVHKKLPVNKGVISLSAKADTSNNNLPSVTRILSATMSEAAKNALAIWKAGMIKKLGVDGFNEYQKNLFKDGHDLHSSIENALLQKEYQIPERVKPAFESVQNVLKDISSVTALETHVVHPKLFYRGITDCVATYRGELCLIDWKKSDKRKDTIDSVYDAPMQVASYIGAMNADLNYPFEVTKGLVVVAYTNGEEATVYEIDGEHLPVYWKAWLKRLQKYFVETSKK
ncbi:mitochondrial genome maintenance exonuclease 1-like [Leptopilina heterotoma]|uniref:mitochondrial genome maintenance exonuclease 1-like n=1 Tax=Leptopilina heterotoma TaxID=63436 RepID=UPI001CA83A99|nr:mitochondrial genome maintenance exonuclease 1-like [Leptopilina heterotoma]